LVSNPFVGSSSNNAICFLPADATNYNLVNWFKNTCEGIEKIGLGYM
jgi:hypothetical protein